jgi:NAD+ kinase
MTMRVTVRGADTGLPKDVPSVVDSVVGVVETGSDSETADLVITVGEQPLSDCAARREERPVLSVGIDADWSADPEELPALLRELTNREPPTVDVAPLVVSVDGHESRAAFDTTLITSEPARISEYGVSVDGRRDTFRADGVVVASPLGSYGYARAAGGPQLDFGTGLAVVPIAPFATIADTWVLEPPLSVSVERDDSVTVFADTTELATGRSELTVDVTTGQPLSLVDCGQLVDSR